MRAALLLLLCAELACAALYPPGYVDASPEGTLMGPSVSAYSPDRKEAWVNLSASGYTEPLWRLEPLVRSRAQCPLLRLGAFSPVALLLPAAG
jgi:hypothetical protein